MISSTLYPVSPGYNSVYLQVIQPVEWHSVSRLSPSVTRFKSQPVQKTKVLLLLRRKAAGLTQTNSLPTFVFHGLRLQVLLHLSPYLQSLTPQLSPPPLSPPPPAPPAPDHQPRRGGNPPSAHRGRRSPSHPRGGRDPSPRAGAAGRDRGPGPGLSQDPGPGPGVLQRRGDQGRGRVTRIFLSLLLVATTPVSLWVCSGA